MRVIAAKIRRLVAAKSAHWLVIALVLMLLAPLPAAILPGFRIEGLRLIGNAAQATDIVYFVMENVHPHDVATCLDRFLVLDLWGKNPILCEG